jgi:protein-S-isoprenylcysteine O-methyltransferase Ste14
MRVVDHLTHTGDALFRWRSYLPLLLVPAFIASFVSATYLLDSHLLDLVWELGCFLLSMAGLAIRVVTVGTAPHGTSGRNTRRQRAEVLNTTGPYAVVRHPLYVANGLIALGLACFSRTWFLPVIVSLAAFLYYERIAAREEEYLDARFGEAFRRWAARVPAMIPRFANYTAPARPFDWRKAARQECHGLFVIGVGFFALEVTQDFVVHGQLMVDPVWSALAIATTMISTTAWVLKRRGFLRPRPEPGPALDGSGST